MRNRTDLAARSDPGRARERNEDRWLARDYATTLLLAVADGVGGIPGGDVASDTAIGALAGAFRPPAFRESAQSALAEAVQQANRAVLAAQGGRANPQGASTLVAAAIRGRQAAIANLGDSRAYLIRRGAVRQLTADHSGAQAHSITRYVGDPRGVQPDLFVETLEPGDRLVLCSDGLTRHVADDEIGRAAADAPERAAEALVALANERGGEDNITVVVYAAAPRRLARAFAGLAILAILLVLVLAGALGAVLLTPHAAPLPLGTPAASALP